MIEVLCEAGHSVDLLTYHEGEDIEIDGLQIKRVPKIPFVTNIPIGFSWKKIICDVLLSAKLLALIMKNNYQVIHAVEESVYPALIAKYFKKNILVYDMDSSMADQLIEKWSFLRNLDNVLYAFETAAIKRVDAVFVVCEELAKRARTVCPNKRIEIIEDVALYDANGETTFENLRQILDISGTIALYVGNLEHYQGIDLMLEGFAKTDPSVGLDLVIIGGNHNDILKYKQVADEMGILKRTHFIGPRPVSKLMNFLKQADILVSPRIKGQNTPMKIYSYLAAGKPILATNIISHTQVLNSSCALLVEPHPTSMGKSFRKLVQSPQLRVKLGRVASRLAETRHSKAAFRKKVIQAYVNLTSN
jgi:glycosyltransferase involved in cell wall biosynthesis